MDKEQLLLDIHSLEHARIFFGHQSVGNNIIQGVRDLLAADSVANVHIVRWDAAVPLPSAYLAEAPIGENAHPDTKCAAFAGILDSAIGSQVDIAVMKFCYVDIVHSTDVSALFRMYRDTVDSLKRRHPSVTFVHVTAPVTFATAGWKRFLGKLRNKTGNADLGNVKRAEFNALLTDYYKNDPIFDLARIESTHPDGSRETFRFAGRDIAALVPAYAADAGHLNELGRRAAAVEFIHTLAIAYRKHSSLRNP